MMHPKKLGLLKDSVTLITLKHGSPMVRYSYDSLSLKVYIDDRIIDILSITDYF